MNLTGVGARKFTNTKQPKGIIKKTHAGVVRTHSGPEFEMI